MKYILSLFLLTNIIFAKDITVSIIYGDDIPDKTVKTTYEEGMTALDLLNKVSDVKSSKTGKFNFVRSIDGVKSVKGSYGWFYFVDGKSTGKMAESFKLDTNRSMTWYMNKEECN